MGNKPGKVEEEIEYEKNDKGEIIRSFDPNGDGVMTEYDEDGGEYALTAYPPSISQVVDEDKEDEEGEEEKKTTVIAANRKGRVKVPEELTGAKESITQICASISNQIYVAVSEETFVLETSPVFDKQHWLKYGHGGEEASDLKSDTNAEVIIFDKHGDYDASTPAFAVVVFGDTMILGWRGTNGIVDMFTDASIAPVFCEILGDAASGIRVQSTMASLVASDLFAHRDKIAGCIKEKNIKEIVFTGHSLGGALANVAHLFVKAQIGGYNKNSTWTDIPSSTSLRSIVFAAPMSIVYGDKDGNKNKDSDSLIKEVSQSSFNFVFGCDVVPRAYRHFDYIKALVTKVADEDAKKMINSMTRIPLSGLVVGPTASKKTKELFDKLDKSTRKVCQKYQHVGKLLYYANENVEEPEVITVTGNDTEHPKGFLDYDGFGSPEDAHWLRALNAHSFFPKRIAPNIAEQLLINEKVARKRWKQMTTPGKAAQTSQKN